MSRLRSASLGRRLGLAFGSLVLLAVVMGLIGLRYTSQISENAQLIYSQEVAPLEALDDAKSALYRIRGDALEHVLATRPDTEVRLRGEIAQQEQRIRQRLQDYRATRLTSQEQQLLSEFEREFEAYVTLVRRDILPLSTAGRKQPAEELALGPAVDIFRAARDTMNALMDYNLGRAAERARETERYHSRAMSTHGLTLALVAGLGMAVSLYVTRSVTRAVRARQQAQADLAYQAFHDDLTQLPNRALFLDRLHHAYAAHARDGRELAVLMLDLDGFKLVNDSAGHPVGDALLRQVADRVARCVRASDTVARLGGDEFGVLLEHADQKGAQGVAASIVDALAAPYRLADQLLTITCSVGIANVVGATDADQILRNADVALYSAKAAGKNGVAVYDETMYDAVARRIALQADLRTGLEQGQVETYFQPLVSTGTGQIVAFEALARWRRPVDGVVSPTEFIPLAEECGLIKPLGRHVLQTAVQQAVTWSNLTQQPIAVAVNVSVRQLEQPGFPATVAATLRTHGLPPSRLVLKVTESALADPQTPAVAALHEIRSSGVRIAIDDFGTGYSSLGQLRTLPVDELKIDRLFIEEVVGDPSGTPVLAAIVAMAQSLGLELVAEGVDTEEQLAVLQNLGCGVVQGFLFGPAIPAWQVRQLLKFPPAALSPLSSCGSRPTAHQSPGPAAARRARA